MLDELILKFKENLLGLEMCKGNKVVNKLCLQSRQHKRLFQLCSYLYQIYLCYKESAQGVKVNPMHL